MALLSFGRDFDPVNALLELQRELDRFLSKPPGWDFGLSGGGVFPPVNMFTDREGVVVRAEVPGVNPDTLDIKIERNTLSVSGERKANGELKGSFHRRERRFGKFSRSLRLPPDLDGEKASAECRNGVLTIRIPKSEQAKPRHIKVRAA